MQAIVTHNLTKRFGSVTALANVSITVNQGEIYGFIGLNGAGKTTLIRSLLGMVSPTEGSASIFGEAVTKNFNQWNKVGYMVETPYNYPQLTVYENLQVCYELRAMRDKTKIDGIIELLELTQYRNRKAGTLSLGNQQRLGIAKAMLHHPQLLILDEPINGLDPQGIIEVRELLKQLASQGVTIFLSSHILEEVSKIADKLGIIHQGSMMKELTTAELNDSLLRKLVINTDNNEKASKILVGAGYSISENGNSEIELTGNSALSSPGLINKTLATEGIYADKLLLSVEDLEKFFLRSITQ